MVACPHTLQLQSVSDYTPVIECPPTIPTKNIDRPWIISHHTVINFDLHSSSSKSKPLTTCGGLVWNYQSIWLPALANSTFSIVASSSSNNVNTNAERKREQFEQIKRSAQEIMKARNGKRARYGPCKGPITVNSFLKTEFMDCFSTKTVPEVMKGLPLPLKYDVKMQENRNMLGQIGPSVPTESHFSILLKKRVQTQRERSRQVT